MLEQQSLDQLWPKVGVDKRFPFTDALRPVQGDHAVEQGEEPRNVFQKVLVFVEQEMASNVDRCLDDRHL